MFFPMHREKHPFCFVPGKGTKTTVFSDASRKTGRGQNPDLFEFEGTNGDKLLFFSMHRKNSGDKIHCMLWISHTFYRFG